MQPARHPNWLHRAWATKVKVLQDNVLLSPGFNPAGIAQKTFLGLWDTGAEGTLITQKVVDALGLTPIGPATLHTANGSIPSERYFLGLQFADTPAFPAIEVVRGILNPPTDVLIGMDIIGQGDFSVCLEAGGTTMNFTWPSMGLTAHATHGAKVRRQLAETAAAKAAAAAAAALPPLLYPANTPRNGPCPCGSRKKFKVCCIDKRAVPAA